MRFNFHQRHNFELIISSNPWLPCTLQPHSIFTVYLQEVNFRCLSLNTPVSIIRQHHSSFIFSDLISFRICQNIVLRPPFWCFLQDHKRYIECSLLPFEIHHSTFPRSPFWHFHWDHEWSNKHFDQPVPQCLNCVVLKLSSTKCRKGVGKDRKYEHCKVSHLKTSVVYSWKLNKLKHDLKMLKPLKFPPHFADRMVQSSSRIAEEALI